jgi:hypothetical protein
MEQFSGWISAHYDIIKDFQPIIGSMIGFAGVIFTLWYNGWKDRRLYKIKMEDERKSLAGALSAELEIIARSLKLNSEMAQNANPRGTIYAQKNLYNPVCFNATVSKISLLPTSAAHKVIRLYAFLEDYNFRLLSVGLIDENEDPILEDRGTYYVVHGQEGHKRLATFHSGILNVVNEAIVELSKV